MLLADVIFSALLSEKVIEDIKGKDSMLEEFLVLTQRLRDFTIEATASPVDNCFLNVCSNNALFQRGKCFTFYFIVQPFNPDLFDFLFNELLGLGLTRFLSLASSPRVLGSVLAGWCFLKRHQSESIVTRSGSVSEYQY